MYNKNYNKQIGPPNAISRETVRMTTTANILISLNIKLLFPIILY